MRTMTGTTMSVTAIASAARLGKGLPPLRQDRRSP